MVINLAHFLLDVSNSILWILYEFIENSLGTETDSIYYSYMTRETSDWLNLKAVIQCRKLFCTTLMVVIDFLLISLKSRANSVSTYVIKLLLLDEDF